MLTCQVTAAHCLFYDFNSMTLIFGSSNLKEPYAYKKVDKNDIIIFPGYKDGT